MVVSTYITSQKATNKRNIKMSQLRVLNFKYNLTKWRPGRERQLSDLIGEPNYEPDRKELERVFYKIAGSDNKKIKYKELNKLLTKLGVVNAAAEARRMIKAIGSKEKAIDLECFLDLHKNGVMLREIRHAFSVFDRDRDGRLSAEDIQHTFRMLGESCELKECERMVKQIDRNHDKYVEMDDFMLMMTRPVKKAKT
ncbi:EF hand calcium-binding protein family [Rhynchospora pubera]|uniref:EF hand calcium-binding protein family n=1 Tax=Rhynchospora pubera TaxID=906938 RepID=A0AAV8H6H0_9POAL|nr:EF hand calcium-binding protein family [Rhynchospora pubera]